MSSRRFARFLPFGKKPESLQSVVEEVGSDEEVVVTPSSPRGPIPRSHGCLMLSQYLPKNRSSPSPTKTEAKLLDEESSPASAKLTKHGGRPASSRDAPSPPPRDNQHRSSSAPWPENTSTRLHKPESPKRLQPRDIDTSAEPKRKERSNSLAPPIAPSDDMRFVSSPVGMQPLSYHSDHESNRNRRPRKQKSFMGMSRSRNTSQELDFAHSSNAWVELNGQKMDYTLAFMTNGEKIPEMWAENGDTFVYLFPRESGKTAQFKIHSSGISSSHVLRGLSVSNTLSSSGGRRRSFDGRSNLAIEDATRNLDLRESDFPLHLRGSLLDNQPTSDGSGESVDSLAEGPREYHLYFPTKLTTNGPQYSTRDVQRLVDVRNLFAYIEGQPLVRTRASPTIFQVLLSVASLLREQEFSNLDGSTYGEACSSVFGFFMEVEKLGDVSQSREKTIEGVILGERMRSAELYNEAFAHAVGKYDAVKAVRPELFCLISQNTRNRLERASLDLRHRQRSAEHRLVEFELPSLWAGVAASTSSRESKFVHFKAWKSHFLALRKVVLSYYKDLHGQWPPKASSKKNNFVEGGLNRLVLKGLYVDLCGLYDLLADRESLTTRGLDASEDKDTPDVDPTAAALRRLLGEFDRSSPPVTPPIPFDTPLVPKMLTLFPNYLSMGPKERNMLSNKKLKDHETKLVIAKSHNLYTVQSTSFLEMYKAFEEKESRGKTCSQLADMRYGHWIFMYAVLQCLPMLVVDAPGLRYTEGVEYFLCEPSMGNLPWIEDAGVKREWYGIASSGHAVVLPSDLVLHGVEGIYRRSHCWLMAEKWIMECDTSSMSTAVEIDRTETLSPLQPPPGFAGGELGARPSSRDESRVSFGSLDTLVPERRGRSRQSQRNSIAFGLEKLPIPMSPAVPGSPALSATGSRGSSPSGLNLYENGGRRVSSGTPLSATGGKGSTFDDILGSMPSTEKSKDTGRGKGLGIMGRFS